MSIIGHIKRKTDNIENVIYPITLERAIYDENNVQLNDKIIDIRNQLDTIATKLSQFCNPNLIINPNFKINQRGEASYTCPTFLYTVDRWASQNNGIITPLLHGINFKTSTTGATLEQQVENYLDYAGMTLTLTAKVVDISQTDMLYLAIYDGRKSESKQILGAGIISISCVISDEPTMLDAYIYYGDSGGIKTEEVSIDIEWMKLEVGNVPTEYIPPDNSVELCRCKRYYQLIQSVLSCSIIHTDYIRFPLLYSEMRTKPTISWKNKEPTIETVDAIRHNKNAQASGFTYSFSSSNATYGQLMANKSSHGLMLPISMHSIYYPIALDAEIYF